MRFLVIWLLLALCAPTVCPADAQVRFSQSDARESTQPAATAQPRVEVGVQGGFATLASGLGVFLAVGGLRVTTNISRRNAVELVADLVAPVERPGAYGWYLLHYKRLLKEDHSRRRVIFTILGTGGAFSYVQIPESRRQRPDGSTLVRPAYKRGQLTPPLLVSGGIGVECVLSRRAAVRAEIHALVPRFATIGVRGVLGVSIPIGGYRVPEP